MKNEVKVILCFFFIVQVSAISTIYLNNLNYIDLHENRIDNTRELKISKDYNKIHIFNDNWSGLPFEIRSGSGSYSDPWKIEDLVIDAEYEGSSIKIENSDEYFIIENCTTFNSGYEALEAGILLINSQNGSLIENNCTLNNANGILLMNSENISIIDNKIINNEYTAIGLIESNISEIRNNYISKNGQYGLNISENSKDNLVFLNSLINNKINALDNGINNSWDNGTIGNYWSDYTGKDSNYDYIGDSPYEIAGLGESKDNFPITKETPPIITILDPKNNEEFQDIAPAFEITIEESSLNSKWYTIDQGITNVSFTGSNEIIDPILWYNAPDGFITLRIYANDTLGNIGYDEVNIIKVSNEDPINPNFRDGETEIITTEGFVDPAQYVKTDDYGNIHLLWVENTLTDAKNDRDILYKVWNSTKSTWSEPEIISSASINHSFNPYIEIDNYDNLHVAWSDSTPLDGDPDPDVFYKYKNSTTDEWSDLELVTSNHYEYIEGFVKLEIEDSGAVHIIWDDFGNPNAVEIYYAYRDPTSETWENEEKISLEDGKLSYGADLILDDLDNLHVFWTDHANYKDSGTDADIFHRVRKKSDGLWSEIDVITKQSTQNSEFPSVELGNEGPLYLYWNQKGVDGNYYLFRKVSDLNYNTWSNSEVVTKTGASWSSFIVDSNENIHVVWSERVSEVPEWDLYYKFSNSSTNQWSKAKLITPNRDLNCLGPKIEIGLFGTLNVFWYEENPLPDKGSSLYRKQIIHDIRPPDIDIVTPYRNQEFEEFAPSFEISVRDDNLHSIWYTLDGGITNITVSELTGIINQNEWNALDNGHITIMFYAKDCLGNIASQNVIVSKDAPAPSDFTLEIEAPLINQEFGKFAPAFEINIEQGSYNELWYTIDGGTNNHTLNSLIGTINQTSWDTLEDGNVYFRVYANDTSGKFHYEEVIFYKYSQLQVSIYNQTYSQSSFNVILFICNERNMAITSATINAWWNNTEISENITNVGEGFYKIALNPIFIDSNNPSISLECIITSEGYVDKYYQTQINLDSESFRRESQPINPILTSIILGSSIGGGIGVASVIFYFIRKRNLTP